jgi:hypothetical protein
MECERRALQPNFAIVWDYSSEIEIQFTRSTRSHSSLDPHLCPQVLVQPKFVQVAARSSRSSLSFSKRLFQTDGFRRKADFERHRRG